MFEDICTCSDPESEDPLVDALQCPVHSREIAQAILRQADAIERKMNQEALRQEFEVYYSGEEAAEVIRAKWLDQYEFKARAAEMQQTLWDVQSLPEVKPS